MSYQKWLGRNNVVQRASAIDIPLKDAAGVTVLCFENGGAQAITIEESIAGASVTALAVVDHLYASDGVGSVWTRETTDANGALGTGDAAIVKKDTLLFDVAVFYIGAAELSDTFTHVRITIDDVSTGEIQIILHDLMVQRAPENLAAIV